jgi:Cu/Ag efflux pump CusA
MSASKIKALVRVLENRLVVFAFISILRIFNLRNLSRRSFEPVVRTLRIGLFLAVSISITVTIQLRAAFATLNYSVNAALGEYFSNDRANSFPPHADAGTLTIW